MPAPALNLQAVEAADIRGQKTRLRPMRPDEAPLFYRWATDPDPDLAPFWGEVGRYGDFNGFLEHWQPHYFDGSQLHRGRCFAIEALAARPEPVLSPARPERSRRVEGLVEGPIGMIAYNYVHPFDRSTDIDILIGDPAYRGRGYGTDALNAFLAFLFDTLGLHRVWLATLAYNTRAQRAYEKVGFVREGVMRQADWIDGRWVDSVIYGILDHEFRRESTS